MPLETYSTISCFEGRNTIGHRYPEGPACIVCSLSIDPGDQVFTIEAEVDPNQTCRICEKPI